MTAIAIRDSHRYCADRVDTQGTGCHGHAAAVELHGLGQAGELHARLSRAHRRVEVQGVGLIGTSAEPLQGHLRGAGHRLQRR